MAGQLSKEQIEKLDPEIRRKVEEGSRLIAAQMSPKGALGLPEHLDDKRLEHGIIDGYFDQVATFEKVFVFTIEEDGGETYGGGRIYRTDEARAKDKSEAPRSIIVSAGLKALDVLESNGIKLGDTVTFTRGAVTRIRCGWVDGQQQWLTVLYVDDISGCLDLAQRYRKGELKVSVGSDGTHRVSGAEPLLPDFKGNM